MTQWLTDTLLMTGVLMVLVLLVRRPVERWFGAGAAYALWVLPMLRLVLPPLALPRGLLPHYDIGVEKITVSASVPVEAVVAPVVPAVVTAAPVTAADPGLLAQIPWTELLLAVWLGGAVLFLAWRAIGYRWMRRELLNDARQVARAGDVRIIESPAASAPLAFGVFDKVIALPMGFLATVDSETSDLAIAHELEHHAGSDLLALMAMQPLFALHWFNPVGWAAWRALRSDQEAACDARVMVGRGNEEKVLYGRLIASFAGGGRLALIAPMAGPLSGAKPIIHRLKALTRRDVSPARRVLGRGLFALAVIAVPITATASYAAIDNTGEAESEATPVPPVSPVPPAAPKEASVAPAAPRAPMAPSHAVEAPEPPVPPTPPAAPEARASIERHAAREAARAMRSAAAAERLEADAQRVAADAVARAPHVEQTVSADGKRQVIRFMGRDASGKSVVTREMVIDQSCPAGGGNSTASVGRHGSEASAVICTGAPKIAMNATLNALRSTRASIASNGKLDADVRAEILSDLDEEIADAQRDRHGAGEDN